MHPKGRVRAALRSGRLLPINADVLQLDREAPMTPEAAIYTSVSDALWLQRDNLRTLLYRLVCENLVLTSASIRWLALADDEVRAAVERVRAGELVRAAEVNELIRLRGLDPDASLAVLATSAPEPWGSLLADHRTALRALVVEVQRVAETNRRLLEERS
jgi:hypothetical protein